MGINARNGEGSGIFALWYVEPRRTELRPVTPIEPAPGDVTVRTLFSGISRGTERLVFNGLCRPGHRRRMGAPMQEGTFPFPVKYGYCAVGVVEAGPADLVGRTVFALHPHQQMFAAPAAAVAAVPEGVPARRAVLAANMETALNAVWDGGAGPGDRITVVGAGVVGLLVTFLCAGLPGAEVTVVDTDLSREAVARRLGADFALPGQAQGEADVVFHASGTPAGLATALALCGDEAALVELSWYGDEAVPVHLGGEFHARRLRLVSSQVGQVAASRRPRWEAGRRLAKALSLLADARLDDLITGEVAFADLPEALPSILDEDADGLMTAVRYQ